MIQTFDQYWELNESKQVGVIYHFTFIENLSLIIESNCLKSYNVPLIGIQLPTISLTRDKLLYKKPKTGIGVDVRISLDGTKLSEKYKIEPHNYFNTPQLPSRPKATESEERISSPIIKDLDKYVILYEILPYNRKKITEEQYISYVNEIKNLNNFKVKIIEK